LAESWSIRLEGASKRYGLDVLFEGLDLDLRPREALRLLGPNGSGKTQLLLALCGLNALDRGRLVLEEGAGPVALPDDPNLRDRYVRYLPDTPAALSSLAVAELVLILSRRLDPLSFRSRHRAVAHCFTEFQDRLEVFVGRSLDPGAPTSQLSVGQQKRLALAATEVTGALPRVLLFDEPLAGLDREGIAAVLGALANIRRQGVAIVIAEHRPEIQNLGFDAELTLPYRRSATALPRAGIETPAELTAYRLECAGTAPPVYLEIRGARAGYPGAALRCEELTLRPGELAVIGGTNGSGKTGFLKALLGFTPARFEGHLELAGRPLTALAELLSTGEVRYMSQDRRTFPDLRAEDALRAAGLVLGQDLPDEILQVAQCVGRRKRVGHLSSGNRALLSLAQSLVTRPRLALLDEPTANVDATNRQRMVELIEHARWEWGTAFLVVEHGELPASWSLRYHVQRDAENNAWLQLGPPAEIAWA
jgi:ABC-type multidrug transport system ATPase subunit